MKNLNKSLIHSAELTKILQHALEIKNNDSAKVNRCINELQAQATRIEELLQQMCDEYAIEVNTAKLQMWERKLLDLSLRNNLLNMRLGKNIIAYNHPEIASLEDELAEGKEIVMEQKELKGLFRAVRTNMEETGANTLFLSLGTLKWQEKVGAKQYMAPILLVPVEMVQIKKDCYAIHRRDEDTILNITLLEFLKHQFDINVDNLQPLPQDIQGVDVSLVMHTIRDAIKEQAGWEVVEDSVIGIFSFTKFVMWNDIHTHSAAIVSSDIVRSLIEGRIEVDKNISPADAREMDINTSPNAFALPVDADSSQMEAVVESGNGRSFILYGPPGTGKSQTITNIIANALYQGKRVLFVAQKKAALEVVQSRLQKIGLAPFCLELHSNKMDKRQLLQHMQQSLETVGSTNSEEYQRKSDELYVQRVKLIGYVEALHRKQDCGISLYECIERYLKINTTPMTLATKLTEKMSEKDASELCDKIHILSSAKTILGVEPHEHPLKDMLPKKKPAEKKGMYVSPLMMGDSIEKLLPTLQQIIDNVKQQIKRNEKVGYLTRTTRQYLENDYKWKKFLAVANVNEALLNDIDALSAAVEKWNNNIELMEQWQKYADILSNLAECGLQEAVKLYNEGVSVENICHSYMAGYYKNKINEIITSDPTLKEFNGVMFEKLIERYTILKQEFKQLTQQELVARLAANIPIETKDPVLSSELTLLRKRIGNKGRGTSIRSILDQMPNLLPSLCPVMLMSPLSVSQYLSVDAPKFDLVVFDEASQMPTSEAIGALARAKSAVVVGDPKQMPPTSFFSVNTMEDDSADIDDLESILDDCISLSMPARYLGWHYRSKHESLITFSNRNFYDNRLVTFPSAEDKISKVTWQYVEGYYDYGKTRTNRAEAEAITAEVIERMQQNPDKSIGVVAFSKQQSDLIEDIITEALAKYPELEKANINSTEPFFIKNLENVQGDERDIILFSVGYGPDKEGHVSMNFGPLNKVGGERRLNVAVSRARYEMKIFSTLKPEQIDERRTNAEGVLGLKQFLLYASRGCEKAAETDEYNENQMIKQIASRLEEEGFEVRTSVGKSSLKVDIAVVDPLNPDKYILGIICDGDSYYQLKTMRDREVVQPSVLHMLGWDLMHIWSIDWLQHKDIVMEQIIERITNRKQKSI